MQHFPTPRFHFLTSPHPAAGASIPRSTTPQPTTAGVPGAANANAGGGAGAGTAGGTKKFAEPPKPGAATKQVARVARASTPPPGMVSQHHSSLRLLHAACPFLDVLGSWFGSLAVCGAISVHACTCTFVGAGGASVPGARAARTACIMSFIQLWIFCVSAVLRCRRACLHRLHGVAVCDGLQLPNCCARLSPLVTPCTWLLVPLNCVLTQDDGTAAGPGPGSQAAAGAGAPGGAGFAAAPAPPAPAPEIPRLAVAAAREGDVRLVVAALLRDGRGMQMPVRGVG